MGAENFRRGSYVKAKPCWDDPDGGGLQSWKESQIWRQRLDCAVGCPPFLQYNERCDALCNVPACEFDNGDCKTLSPTPPTNSPTLFPSVSPTSFPTRNPVSGPTAEPTLRANTASPTTSFPTFSPTQVPTRKATKSPTEHPTFPCPPKEIFSFCSKFTKKVCLADPAIRKACVYCFDRCLPRGDERVCEVEGFYDHCQPECPTYDQFDACPSLTTETSCSKSSFGRKNCVWCNNKCEPGINRGVCLSSSFYDHCTNITVPCPQIEQFSICEKFESNKKACSSRVGKNNCTWCNSSNKCMVGIREDVCTINDFYSHCPTSLTPTSAPTISPLIS